MRALVAVGALAGIVAVGVALTGSGRAPQSAGNAVRPPAMQEIPTASPGSATIPMASATTATSATTVTTATTAPTAPPTAAVPPVGETAGTETSAESLSPLPEIAATDLPSATPPPNPSAGGLTPSLPAGVPGSNDDMMPITPPSIGQVTSSADPVRRRVMAVTAAVSAVNPQLGEGEAERVARQIVGRYFQADLSGSVMNDEPVNDSSSQGASSGTGGSSGSGEGVGGVVQHGLEWQGIRSLLPEAAEALVAL